MRMCSAVSRPASPGLSMAECDILENYALKWEIRGAMWTRETPWSAHPDGFGEEWTDEARARLKTVNALRERVQGPFARLKKGVGGSGEAEQKVRALYGYLEEIKLPEVLQTQTEQLFAAARPSAPRKRRSCGAFFAACSTSLWKSWATRSSTPRSLRV